MFPDEINLKIINIETGKPVPDILVVIKLFVRHKNDYYFDFISNHQGIIQIKKSDLHNKIKIEKSIFLMDYASSLEDCELKVEINIKSGAEIDRILQGMIKSKSIYKISDDEIEDLQKVTNKQFEPQNIIINFAGENNKDITLAIKPI